MDNERLLHLITVTFALINNQWLSATFVKETFKINLLYQNRFPNTMYRMLRFEVQFAKGRSPPKKRENVGIFCLTLIFFLTIMGFLNGGEGGSPTWEKFPHFPVFFFGNVPKVQSWGLKNIQDLLMIKIIQLLEYTIHNSCSS